MTDIVLRGGQPAPADIALQDPAFHTATLAIVDDADTLSAAAVLAIAAQSAVLEAADTLAATATLAIAAQLAILEAADTLAATASEQIAASELPAGVADRDDDDVLQATASIAIAASSAIQEAGDALAAAATLSGSVPVDQPGGPTPATGGAYSARRAPAPRRRSSIVASSRADFRQDPPARLAVLVELRAEAAILEDDDLLEAMAIVRPSARQIRARRTLQIFAMQ